MLGSRLGASLARAGRLGLRRSQTGTAWSPSSRPFSARAAPASQRRAAMALAGALGLGVAVAYSLSAPASAKEREQVPEREQKDEVETEITAGERIAGLKEYSKEEVAQHRTADTGVWVTYKNGVYDITEFIANHPGGREKIILAAGSSIEPFWALYAVHKTAYAILEEMRIGNLPEAEVEVETEAAGDGPYSKEPRRHAVMHANSKTPFNGEPPPGLLVEKLVTPVDLFYVRNHLPVPDIKEEDYRLTIEVPGREAVEITLDQLRGMKQHSVTTTVQCAGNRRDEMSSVKEVKGLRWGNAAISTAIWTGVWLRDVLAVAGLDEAEMARLTCCTRPRHIQFEGMDTDGHSTWYGASIPVDKALSSEGDVLLALSMNGEVLPRDHGYPVRAVVPGVVGARNVKWLGKIVASREESGNHWQQRDYKGFSPETNFSNVDWDSAPAIQDMPVTSSICQPPPGYVLSEDEDELLLRGYAWSGGGRAIVRVDVSIDGGDSWLPTELEKVPEQAKTSTKAWAWTLWETRVQVPEEAKGKELRIVCKAVDSSYNVQPDTVGPIWNMRGVLNNSWHRISVSVPQSKE